METKSGLRTERLLEVEGEVLLQSSAQWLHHSEVVLPQKQSAGVSLLCFGTAAAPTALRNCRGLLEAETAGAEPLDYVSRVSSNTTGLPVSLGLAFAVYKSQLKQPPRSPALRPDLGWDELKFCSAQCCSH